MGAGERAERWLIVSNGHGEDQVGALLAHSLRALRPELELEALPLVGAGAAYDSIGVPCLGPRVELPSGGLTVHHPRAALADLRAGLVRTTLEQLRALRSQRPDRVLVVGDVYAHALSSLTPAPRSVVQTLVSVWMDDGSHRVAWQRAFMERIRWPERRLMRGRVLAVYARDEPTAAWLRQRGVRNARWLGNPMMDAVAGACPIAIPAERTVVALLPGSRSYAVSSVRLMLAALQRLGPVLGLVAWTHGPPAPVAGWQPTSRRVPGLLAAWRSTDVTSSRDAPAWHATASEPAGSKAPSESEHGAEVWWLEGRFADVLASARAVLGTTGTAQEQAAGLGLPVVSFAVPPHLGHAFLRNQQRLLGPALRLVEADAETIARALRDTLADGEHRRAAARVGPARMGPPGAAARIAADLLGVEPGSRR